MNKIILTGRTVETPEYKYTQSGKLVALFRFAAKRSYKKDGEQIADFFQRCRIRENRRSAAKMGITCDQHAAPTDTVLFTRFDAV